MMDNALLILTNFPTAQGARTLAMQLIESRLAACVNILPGVESIYRWQCEIETGNEVTLMVKTISARYADVEAAIKLAHPYQMPEIIAIPIVEGAADYLDWIAQETKKDVNV